MNTVWLGFLETRSFEFCSVGRTEVAAYAALRNGWDRHREEYRRNGAGDLYTFEELRGAGAVCLIEVPFGGCLRDKDIV